MDMSKAFGTLNHDFLVAKLHRYGFNHSALALMREYLTIRWQRAKIKSSFSFLSELLSGVPQGSNLGPLLFNIYKSDIFWLNDILNYADDTTIYACDKEVNSTLLKLISNGTSKII